MLLANAPEAQTWLPGVTVVRDLHPGAGGLAGVHAGLALGADLLVVAWDMPFVPPALLTALRRRAHEDGADACVPESAGPRGFEPFCAFYAHRLLGALGDFLAAGGGGAHDFLRATTLSRLPLAEVRSFGDPAVMFLGVNTPEELERARGIERPE